MKKMSLRHTLFVVTLVPMFTFYAINTAARTASQLQLKIPPQAPLHSLLSSDRDKENCSPMSCVSPCSNHGAPVAVNVSCCECMCLDGWEGEHCERLRSDVEEVDRSMWAQQNADWSSWDNPQFTYNLSRWTSDVVMPNLTVHPRCRAAAVQYYLKHYMSEEFRTDRALNFFWTLIRDSLFPRCSTRDAQIVVVDVGANVGEHLPLWKREFLDLSECATSDTVLVVVEPNPLNLPILRRRASSHNKALSHQNESTRAFSGRIVVVDSAMSHYDGIGVFTYNTRNTNMKGRQAWGNERGSLNAISKASTNRTLGLNSTFKFVFSRVESLSSLFQRLQRKKILSRWNTITLLKIDAEGYDPSVIYGAAELLPRTKLVIFECHKLWKIVSDQHHHRSANITHSRWNESVFSFSTLFHVTQYFSRNGFDSYKMGLFYWIPLTPPWYWDDAYEGTMQWSNCIAIRRGYPFNHMFSIPPCLDIE